MSKYDPNIHHRRSIRLKGYDYTQPGAYFVTICTDKHKFLLSEIVNGEAALSQYGLAAQRVWAGLPQHYPYVVLDEIVLMPNHVHCIIFLTEDPVGAGLVREDFLKEQSRPAPTKRHGLPEIVRAFKSFSAHAINLLRGVSGVSVWQRNYYEHIVRSEPALKAIRQYIYDNPMRWELDKYNPAAVGVDSQAAALWKMLQQKGVSTDNP